MCSGGVKSSIQKHSSGRDSVYSSSPVCISNSNLLNSLKLNTVLPSLVHTKSDSLVQTSSKCSLSKSIGSLALLVFVSPAFETSLQSISMGEGLRGTGSSLLLVVVLAVILGTALDGLVVFLSLV